MKVLMFTWEFPPLISGGMGMACYGMIKSLLKLGVEIDLVLPTREMIYFPLVKVEDVDLLPVVYLDPIRQKEFSEMHFLSMQEKMEYMGMTVHPETYLQMSEIKHFHGMKTFTTNERNETIEIEKVWLDLALHLMGDEDLFQKVQEFTFRAEKIAKTLQYDIIHCHDWLTYPAGMIAKKISNKPLVVHIHATEFDRSGGTGDERIHKIEHAGMLYADRVIAVSKYTSQMIMSRYRVDTMKIRIIHNAYTIDDDVVYQRKRLFLGPTILFLGRITLQKGPDYFLDVAEKVLQSHPEARFIMAGSGDMARKILRKSASMKLKNRFLFTGFLNRNQVEKILSASDIYMLPSVSEPFGIAPLEAMAYGVTAIISRQAGVAEVVNNAFKIDFWDIDRMTETLNYLLDNPDACEEMGRKGKIEVHQIEWDAAAVKINEVYSEITL
jgi:glycogen synthase